MALPQRKSSQQDTFTPAAGNQTEAAALPDSGTPQTDYQQKQQALRIGEILKRERERRGYDLQQIADYLCIRRGLLAALENSRYEEFPADAYVIGFLRSYADLIGLDGQQAINHYRQEMAGRRRKPDLVLPTPVSEGRAPTAAIMGAAALASLLIYILWYAFSTSDRATVSTPPALPTPAETTGVTPEQAPAGTDALPASAPSGIAISAPAPLQKSLEPAANNLQPAAPSVTVSNATPVPGSTHLVIKASQSSWVLIANDKGQTVYDRVMKPGDVYEVPDMPGLTLTTGNGAGIALTLDGVDLPQLSSTASHMVRNLALDAKSLKALPQQPGQ
jgi:cytoskeleton protein RodZ